MPRAGMDIPAWVEKTIESQALRPCAYQGLTRRDRCRLLAVMLGKA
jgi:hypothetical protein